MMVKNMRSTSGRSFPIGQARKAQTGGESPVPSTGNRLAESLARCFCNLSLRTHTGEHKGNNQTRTIVVHFQPRAMQTGHRIDQTEA
jgi:hypothetical protein